MIWQKNPDVRSQMFYQVDEAKRQIPLWVVANRLGIHENTFRNWLNKKDMHDERKEAVVSAIRDVRSELEEHRVAAIHPPERVRLG